MGDSIRRSGRALADRAGPFIPFLIVLLIALQVAATRSTLLITHPLWLDEYHTLLLVEDPDLGHSMEALKHGADVNVPALFLMTRAVTRLVGSTDPVVLRAVGLAGVIAGLVGLHLAIRRVYPVDVAFIAAIAAWTHPILIAQVSQARFYGPWFGGIVWFAYALNLRDRSRRKLGPGLLVASTAVFVCTIHYFGIISLGLVVAAHTLCAGGSWRAALARLVPVAAGPLALAAFVPFYLGQRASLSVPTWVGPPGLGMLNDFLSNIFPYYLFALPVGGLLASLLLARGIGGEPPDREAGRLAELAGLAGLALFPLPLIAFSYLVHSVVVNRYCVVAVASASVLIAPVLARTSIRLRWAVLLGLLAYGSGNLVAVARSYRAPEAVRAATSRAVAALPEAPVLFKWRATMYDLWWDAPGLRSRFHLLEPGELGGRSSDLLRIEADMARNHRRWYGMPGPSGLDSIGSAPVAYLVGLDLEDLASLREAHSEFSFRRVDEGSRIDELTRKPPEGPGVGRSP